MFYSNCLSRLSCMIRIIIPIPPTIIHFFRLKEKKKKRSFIFFDNWKEINRTDIWKFHIFWKNRISLIVDLNIIKY